MVHRRSVFRAVTALAAAGWLLGAGLASAQVAVPRMVPASPTIGDPTIDAPTASYVPANPAAIQWGEPSKWGFGRISSERKQTSPATTDQPVAFSGFHAGYRSVGKGLTFAAEALELKDDTNAVLEADWNVLDAGAAFLSGDNIAFGIGADRTSTSNSAESLEYNAVNLGISVAITEQWYAGLVLGTEEISSSFQGSDERTVQKLGIGYRKGGQRLYHLEAFSITKEAADTSGSPFTDVTTYGAVGEINLGGLLASTTVFQTTRERLNTVSTVIIADVGYAPKTGLAVLYHVERVTNVDDSLVASGGNSVETEVNTTAVTVAYQW